MLFKLLNYSFTAKHLGMVTYSIGTFGNCQVFYWYIWELSRILLVAYLALVEGETVRGLRGEQEAAQSCGNTIH